MSGHRPECEINTEPAYMFNTVCTCYCTCKTDPYNCPRGQSLVRLIRMRKMENE